MQRNILMVLIAYHLVIFNSVIAADGADNAEKITADSIKIALGQALEKKNFDEAFKKYFYLELCVEADWKHLSPVQRNEWGLVSERLMNAVYRIYKGSERRNQLLMDMKEKVKVRDELLGHIDRDQLAVDVSLFLGGTPLIESEQLKKERIALLKRVGGRPCEQPSKKRKLEIENS